MSIYYTRYSDSVLLFKHGQVILKVDHLGSQVVSPEAHAHYNYYFNSFRKNINHCIGIVGIVNLVTTRQVVVLTSAALATSVGGCSIYKISQCEFVPIKLDSTAASASPSRITEDDKTYLEMVKYHLRNANLLYSTNFDLSNSLQRIFSSSQQHRTVFDPRTILSNLTSFSASSSLDPAQLIQNFNPDYFWNQHLLQELVESPQAAHFIIPLIYGYADFRPLYSANLEDHRQVYLGVVSRRSKHRAGSRYFRRGIDTDGNTANFNETEQVVIVKNSTFQFQIFSFVQIRGSIPLHWAEINNLRYKPMLSVSKNSNFNSTVLHFKSLPAKFPKLRKVYVVNLVNGKGHELPIKKALESTMAELIDDESSKEREQDLDSILDTEKKNSLEMFDKLPELDYVYFDFHDHCKHMNYSNINLLLSTLQQRNYSCQDYFRLEYNIDMKQTSFKVLSNQRNLIRTNCMDCLDRTNVVQSVVAKWVLANQLAGINFEYRVKANNNVADLEKATSSFDATDPKGVVNSSDESTGNTTTFNSTFNDMWTFNGNYISKAYSGTSALKSDFTRTGKRTVNGAVRDLINSIVRYFKNNFCDGYRQDSFDLFLGKFQPSIFNEFIDYRQYDLGTSPQHADTNLDGYLKHAVGTSNTGSTSKKSNKAKNRFSTTLTGNYTPYGHHLLARPVSYFYPSNINMATSPFTDSRPFKYQSMPYLLLLTTALFCSVIFFPKDNTIMTRSNLLLLSCCLAVIGWSLYFIANNGIQFVSWPKLCEVDYLRKTKILGSGGNGGEGLRDDNDEVEGFEYVVAEEFETRDLAKID